MHSNLSVTSSLLCRFSFLVEEVFILDSEPQPPRYPSKQVSFSAEVSQIPRGPSVSSTESGAQSREGTPSVDNESERESSSEPFSPTRGPKPEKPPKPSHLKSMRERQYFALCSMPHQYHCILYVLSCSDTVMSQKQGIGCSCMHSSTFYQVLSLYVVVCACFRSRQDMAANTSSNKREGCV